MGVKIGSKYISDKYYIDDLSLMTGKIEDLQKACVLCVCVCVLCVCVCVCVCVLSS